MSVASQLKQILHDAVEAKVAPGISLSYSIESELMNVSVGHSTYETDAPRVSELTIYDVASITKSIPVGLLTSLALQEGKISLTDKVTSSIPELKGRNTHLITVKDLITYTAIWDIPDGLAAISRHALVYQQVLDTIFSAPLRCDPNTKHYYTNTPAIILTILLERIYKQSLDLLASKYIFSPLSIESATFEPGHAPFLVSPTEIDPDGTVVERIVHDETARLAMKSNVFAGNAGLFINATDLGKLCQKIVLRTPDIRSIYTDETMDMWSTNLIPHLETPVSLGWELDRPNFMGRYATSRTFGKTGFTGCLVVLDPDKRRSFSLLMNAQYPKRHKNRDAINQLRTSVANIILGNE